MGPRPQLSRPFSLILELAGDDSYVDGGESNFFEEGGICNALDTTCNP
jgi:hypothetical protein